jgi:hypothetical protein
MQMQRFLMRFFLVCFVLIQSMHAINDQGYSVGLSTEENMFDEELAVRRLTETIKTNVTILGKMVVGKHLHAKQGIHAQGNLKIGKNAVVDGVFSANDAVITNLEVVNCMDALCVNNFSVVDIVISGSVIGITGLTGPTGAMGATGNTGNTGANGSTGAVGEIGAVGNTGAMGATGTAGSPGANGSTGAVGQTGAVGNTGAMGSTGTVGNTGTNGSTGAIGGTGAVGNTGAMGAAGTVGNTGANGSTGAVGATGAVGNTGALGVTGNSGNTGANGSTGAIGQTGAVGFTGATGATGSVGATGVANNAFVSYYTANVLSPITIGSGQISISFSSANIINGSNIVVSDDFITVFTNGTYLLGVSGIVQGPISEMGGGLLAYKVGLEEENIETSLSFEVEPFPLATYEVNSAEGEGANMSVASFNALQLVRVNNAPIVFRVLLNNISDNDIEFFNPVLNVVQLD